MEASVGQDSFDQNPGDPDELTLVQEQTGTSEEAADIAEVDDNVIELPVDPDAVLRSVLDYLGFRGRTLEDKINDLKNDPDTRRELLTSFQDEALAKQER